MAENNSKNNQEPVKGKISTGRMQKLLTHMVQREASDLHICVGIPPELRISGELVHMELEPLRPDIAQDLVYELLTDGQIARFEKEKELDLSYTIEGIGRFRINVYRQRGCIGMAARAIPYTIPTIEELGIPPIAKDFADKTGGLFLVTGPVGVGKSTTLAAMLEYINSTRKERIITIEDPIEYLFKHKKSTIDQREVGADTPSFKSALRRLFRQDPNIIFIGEMRDLESIQMAITLAETGHLILTTLHTLDTVHAVTRIVDTFPPYQQGQVRLQLSMVLIGIMAQQLIRRYNKKGGRVLATEVMNITPSIRNLIRENDLPQIYSTLQTSKKSGMHTMNQCLVDLYQKGEISYESALQYSHNQDELLSFLSSREVK